MHDHSTPSHPVQPEPIGDGEEAPAGNPTQLPVEPEFGPALPQPQPEDLGVPRPAI